MGTILPDRPYIPPPVVAARHRSTASDRDQLARIMALDEERMADSLAFLAGYAPGVLDAILTATEPCPDDLPLSDSDALEPYCTDCGAKAGVFIGLGADWRHYAGDPGQRTAAPFEAGHAPIIGWRPATDRCPA
jgi:hypothetical protein